MFTRTSFPYIDTHYGIFMCFIRQFGANKASNGSLSLFVGFATKKVRQSTTTSTTSSAVTGQSTSTVPTSTSTSGVPWTIVQDVGLLSTLAVASIVAALFM
jgi:hypothetical protein